ncbi:hypothetical protein RYX36_008314 [Vicia faba]
MARKLFITSLTIFFSILIEISSSISDIDSLLKLKTSFQNTDTALSSWNTSVPPCDGDNANWSGVLCYKGHIWGFKLENMNLKGTIDVNVIKDLPYIRTISFMHNQFDSPWPNLHKLSGLKTIYLSDNKFSGEIPDDTFKSMQWLKKIHLSNNQFTDDQGDSTRSRLSSNSSSRREEMKLSFVREEASEQFDLQDLLRASAEILGSGCHSSSYKAGLLTGSTVVVKRFKQMNNFGREEFKEHMRRLGRLNHPNLISLLAYYYKRDEKLFVTDFIHNGSLAVRLHGYQAIGQVSLDWPKRLAIVKGVAQGIEYLYKEMPNLIAPHGHLKSSNVLLSDSMEPILTDYGLIPVINQDIAHEIMVAYKSPEYLQHGRITKKTDVWSLGLLTLEILTGKFPANFIQQSEVSLANWVDSVVQEEWTSQVFDKDMEFSRNSEGEIFKLLKIALACCEMDVDKRLDLNEAVDRIQEVQIQEDNNEVDL